MAISELLNETSKALGEVVNETEHALIDMGKAILGSKGQEQPQAQENAFEKKLTDAERASDERKAWAEAQWAAITKNREKAQEHDHDLSR